MKKSTKEPSRSRRGIEFVIVMALLYVGQLLWFHFSPEKTQWVTDSWKVSSKEDAWVYPLVFVVQLCLILGGCIAGLWLAVRMLVSEYRRFWFGGFFMVLGAGGWAVWSVVSTAEEEASTAHIPYIGGGFIVLGLVILLFFKAKKVATK